MTLVVGATGLLGTEICRQLREAAIPVKGLVRRGADPAKIDNLKKLGVELVEGDLKHSGRSRGRQVRRAYQRGCAPTER